MSSDKNQNQNQVRIPEQFIESAFDIAKAFVPKDNDEVLANMKELENMLFSLLKEMNENRNNPDYDLNKTKEIYNLTEKRLYYMKQERTELASFNEEMIKNLNESVMRFNKNIK